ncbi:macrophage mannose receptor 1 [Pempheris klunzingeri]|uniref:macrophage mannose receptor 1 n=1 Tax=Pempheris klunzingeri TaxID=3127111 RepID=UPI0039801316
MVWLQSVIPFTGILLLLQWTTALPKPLQYHLINDLLTWYEAQSFCRVKYSDLATVNNMHDKNMLVKMLGSHMTRSWIGLQRGGTRRWMWSDGSGRARFTKWMDGEPNNDSGSEWCGELSEKDGWNDLPCEEEKGFVCYERQNGKERYVYHSEKRGWVSSLEQCRSEHTDMAYVNTEEDNSEIAELTKTWTSALWMSSKVWIGLFNDAWVWSDGRETSFRNWLNGSPNGGDCASVLQQGHWVGANCNDKATFVCQGGLKVKRMVIRVKVRSDGNLTDSTVTDALLEKLETGLRLQMVTDFTIRWRKDKSGVIFQHQEQLEVTDKTGY